MTAKLSCSNYSNRLLPPVWSMGPVVARKWTASQVGCSWFLGQAEKETDSEGNSEGLNQNEDCVFFLQVEGNHWRLLGTTAVVWNRMWQRLSSGNL